MVAPQAAELFGVRTEGALSTSLRFASICDGISAAGCAWVPRGWTFVFKSEIESFPIAVSNQHFPTVPNLGDMTRFKEWPDYAIDVLVGGTPCQSFSVAGLRAGLADPRGNLALTFLAIAARYRPAWVVWENVPGVHSSWTDAENCGATSAAGEVESRARRLALEAGLDGETIGGCGEFEEVDQTSDFDCFLAGLEELGYGAATCVLDAQYFGVAQRRERVFVVGHTGGQWQRAAAVLFERASLSGNPAPRREPRKGTADSTQAGFGVGGEELGKSLTGNTGGIDREDRHTLVCAGRTDAIAFNAKDSGADAGTEVSPMLRALNHDKSHANGGWSVAAAIPVGIDGGQSRFALRSNPSHSGDKGDGGVNTTMVAEVSPTLRGNERNNSNPKTNCDMLVAHAMEVAPCLTQNYAKQPDNSDTNTGPCLITHALKGEGFDASEDGTGRGTPLVPEVAWALQERDSKGSDSKGSDSSTKDGHLLPCQSQTTMAVRRLTPRECERLQGFPDNWTRIAWRGKPVEECPDGPRYKALGNSMAVPVMAWIGSRIELVEAHK